jgi:hypothetical protein
MAQVMLFSALDARKIPLFPSPLPPLRTAAADGSSNSSDSRQETGVLQKR